MSIGTRLKSILDVFSTIAVICAAGALLWTIFLQRPAAPAPLRQIEHVTGLWIDAEQITNVSGTGGIAIVEFSDFQCPFCGRYAREILPTIKKEFVASGRVKYVALHYPLEAIHPLALQASEAAECAGRQGQFWEMHEKLFAESVALADHGLLDYADALGLDRVRFEQCIDENEALEKIRADQAEGRRLGVRVTPTFFIGTMRADGGIDLVSRIRGAAPVEVLANEIKRLRSL